MLGVVAPGVDGQVDGALVMLITPGTKQAADLDQLDKLARLVTKVPVGVDGGVTHRIAKECDDRGASYLVSGRDLLLTSTTTHPHDHERRPA